MGFGEWLEGAVRETGEREMENLAEIPSVSPQFDAEWESRGGLLAAVKFVREWVLRLGLQHAQIELIEGERRPPALLVTIDTPNSATSVLILAHLDKAQMPQGAFPQTTPVREGRVCGWGVAEFGPAAFVPALAVKALQREGLLRHRVQLLFITDGKCARGRKIEGLGQSDLLCHFGGQVPDEKHLYCLAWARAALTCDISAQTLTADSHSGLFGGLVPDSFGAVGEALDVLEQALPDLDRDMPPECYAHLLCWVRERERSSSQGREGRKSCGGRGLRAARQHLWAPAMGVVWQRGMPSLEQASNIIHKEWTVGLYLSLPPPLPASAARETLERALSKSSVNSRLSLANFEHFPALGPAPLPPELEKALEDATLGSFGHKCMFIGSARPLPCAAHIAELAGPLTACVVSGAATPDCNADGPNESVSLVHLTTLAKAVARLLAAFPQHS